MVSLQIGPFQRVTDFVQRTGTGRASVYSRTRKEAQHVLVEV
jgi:hypothetical protein